MTAREITLGVWIVLAVIAVGLECVAHIARGRVSTAGTVVRLALRPATGRVLVSIAWMWLGWHVFAR